MGKVKLGGAKASDFKSMKASNFPQLSGSMFKEMMSTIRAFTNAGASSLIPSYYSSNWVNDFLHSAGLITDQCYQDNRLWGDIFAGTSAAGDVLGSILGSGGIAPVLKVKTEQNISVDKVGSDLDLAELAAAADAAAMAAGISDVENTIG